MNQKIVYCNCSYARAIPASTKATVLEQLSDEHLDFEGISDLCDLAARDKEKFNEIIREDTQLIACFPRAIKGLCHAAGDTEAEKIQLHNMRGESPEDIVANITKESSERSQPLSNIILYEGRGSDPLDIELKKELLNELFKAGHHVSCIRYELELIDPSAPIVILAALSKAENPETFSLANQVHCLNLNQLSIEYCITQVEQLLKQENQDPFWKPWFPVIDRDRCTDCMQCLTFCLFDVYGTNPKGELSVEKPMNCKTDCPACSRVCPEAAIMFPKYRGGPINGDEVKAEDMEREKVKIDISSLLGGDIHTTLRARSEKAKSRFSKERDESKALRERKKCLDKLKKDLDIPDEVLSSLPDERQILEKVNSIQDSGRH